MNVHDPFEWVNAVVGGVGLALTIVAIVQATGAKSAARDARRAVYRRNAKDDVDRLLRLASGLLTALETEQYDLALHKARDFISDCADVREHHRGRLGREGGRLEVANGLVAMISQRILVGGVKREDLIADVQRVVGDVSGLTGALSRDIEEEGQ